MKNKVFHVNFQYKPQLRVLNNKLDILIRQLCDCYRWLISKRHSKSLIKLIFIRKKRDDFLFVQHFLLTVIQHYSAPSTLEKKTQQGAFEMKK